jgi:hypothetical protein
MRIGTLTVGALAPRQLKFANYPTLAGLPLVGLDLTGTSEQTPTYSTVSWLFGWVLPCEGQASTSAT